MLESFFSYETYDHPLTHFWRGTDGRLQSEWQKHSSKTYGLQHTSGGQKQKKTLSLKIRRTVLYSTRWQSFLHLMVESDILYSAN